MNRVEMTKQFTRDYKRTIKKKGFSRDKLEKLLDLLLDGQELPKKYREHNLKYTQIYRGCKECHITADWLIIYIWENGILKLVRTGTHQELFRNSYEG